MVVVLAILATRRTRSRRIPTRDFRAAVVGSLRPGAANHLRATSRVDLVGYRNRRLVCGVAVRPTSTSGARLRNLVSVVDRCIRRPTRCRPSRNRRGLTRACQVSNQAFRPPWRPGVVLRRGRASRPSNLIQEDNQHRAKL